jgi:hypothetical protein
VKRCIVSELQRARRLPVFIDEEQWSRAFEAAKTQVESLVARGILYFDGGVKEWHAAAVAIATAALRAAAQDDEGDITDLPGVAVAEIGNHTANYQSPVQRSLEK